MQAAVAARKPQPSATSRAAVPRAWLFWAAAVVIFAQLVAMGLVVSRQVELAAARQAAALQKAPPASVAAAGPAAQVVAQK